MARIQLNYSEQLTIYLIFLYKSLFLDIYKQPQLFPGSTRALAPCSPPWSKQEMWGIMTEHNARHAQGNACIS